MTLPVIVTPLEDRFSAALAGAPETRGIGASRAEAIAALKAEVLERVQRGELVWLDIETTGVLHLAGKYADDPALREICADIYRQRDAELNG